MFDCGCHDNDTSDALNMAFFVHSPWKPTTTQKDNGAFKNLFPTLLHFLQELIPLKFAKDNQSGHVWAFCPHRPVQQLSLFTVRYLTMKDGNKFQLM